jgi:galactose mutarotase-like enzyme
LENEVVRIEVLLDKGTDIVSFLHKPSDTDFMFRSALGLRPAASFSREPTADLTNVLDSWEGGWQECLPNGGPGVTYKGAPIPFHGEVAKLPWQFEVIENGPAAVAVRLSVRTVRTPYRLEKTLTLRRGRGVLEIDERLTNESIEPMELMWGHHPAFGSPFLDASCRIDLPACTATTRRAERLPTSEIVFGADFEWPHAPLAGGGTRDLRIVQPATGGAEESVCLSGFDQGWYGITNTDRRVGFGLRWDPALFRHLWFWQVCGSPGYPWYGRHYNYALEPWTSWPDDGLSEAIANGSALRMEAGQTIETRLMAIAYAGRDSVRSISDDGEVD